jgi:hypothetical protein
MRTSLTVGYDAEGASTLLAGPEVPAAEQKAKFAGYVAGKLPKNIVRVELWVSDQGRAKKAICPKHGATMAKEAQAQEDKRQKEKKAALEKLQKAEAKKLEDEDGGQRQAGRRQAGRRKISRGQGPRDERSPDREPTARLAAQRKPIGSAIHETDEPFHGCTLDRIQRAPRLERGAADSFALERQRCGRRLSC